MVEIISDTGTAQQAVSKLTGIQSSMTPTPVSFSGSTVASMTKGKEVNSQVLSELSSLANCILNQAQKFPQIAQKIAQNDQQSANQFRRGGVK